MKSTFSITYEVLDMPQAAKELASGIADFELEENSLGILFCDSELPDYSEFMKELYGLLGFDIAGCTSVATLSKQEGICEMSISLLVLTATDCHFRTVLSDPICHDNVKNVIKESYAKASGQLKGECKMILAYAPYILDIMNDVYPVCLSNLSGNLPVFGGVAGYNAPYGQNAILYNDNAYEDRFALVLIEGNVKPVYSIGVKLSHVVKEQRTITKSEENVIYTIDDMTVPEYLEDMGLDPKKLADDDTDILFVSNPFILTKKGTSADDYRLIRTFQDLKMDEGVGISLCNVPQGHQIALGAMSRRDVGDSAEESLKDLIEKIKKSEEEEEGYTYSTILSTSCAGRYMVMAPKTEVEGDVLKKFVPENLNFAGYYSYGEFGPTSVHDGEAMNTAQNESLTLCAF